MEVSEAGKLLELCGRLSGLDTTHLQISINTYLEEVTGAATALIVPIERKTRDSLFVQVIGTKKQETTSIPVERVLKEQLDQCKVIHLNQLSSSHIDEIKAFLGSEIESFVSIPIPSPPSPAPEHQTKLTNGDHDSDSFREKRSKTTEEAALIVCLVNKSGGTQFTETDVKLVQECFRVCVGILLNTFAYEEEKRLRGQFQKLLTVAKNMFTHLDDVTVLLRQIMAEARMLTQAERCSLFLVDRKHKELIAKVFDGNLLPDGNIEQCPEVRLPLGQGIAGHVASTGELINIKDAYHHPLFYKGVDQDTGFKTRNLLCFPICDETGVIGVAELCNKENAAHFTKYDEEMAIAFSVYCGLAIMHSLMYKRVADAQYRSKLSNELMMYHMKVPDDEVQHLVGSVAVTAPGDKAAAVVHPHPHFTRFDFNPRSILVPESAKVVFSMFGSLGLIQRWRIPEETLGRFILMVKRGYRDPPYHNWSHAFCVSHFCYLVLKNLQLVQKGIISELESLGLLVACLCHDVDHRGTNNSFQSLSNSVLAALYSSEGSVMERHHFAQSMCILNTDGCNILENLTKQEYTRCLDLLRDNILSTDIAHHLRVLPDMVEMARSGYDPASAHHHNLLSSLIMTSSDLSDQTKDWTNSKQIAQLVYTEFFTQGDLEKAMGNRPVESMDRERAFIPQLQIQFLDHIAIPVFRVLGDLFPEARAPYSAVSRTKEYWERAGSFLKERGTPGDIMDIFQDATLDELVLSGH